jgi:hypothetical protein
MNIVKGKKKKKIHANLQTCPTPSTFTVNSAMYCKISSTRCKMEIKKL